MKTAERLQEIKGLRAVSEWERWAGIARGNLDRALKDGKLSDANLRHLCRAENLRADWVLTGKGSPFQLAVFPTDYCFSERLCAHYTDEADSWTLTLIIRQSDQLPVAVVLSMPGEQPLAVKDQALAMVRYSILEVLVGPIGPHSIHAIKREGWAERRQITLDDSITERLCKGELGTYALMDKPGYLKAIEPLSLDKLSLLEVAETPNSYQMPLSPPEQKLLADYRAMPDDDRKRLLVIAGALKALEEPL